MIIIDLPNFYNLQLFAFYNWYYVCLKIDWGIYWFDNEGYYFSLYSQHVDAIIHYYYYYITPIDVKGRSFVSFIDK